MDELADRGDLGMFLQHRPDFVGLAEDQEAYVATTFRNLHQPGDDHGGAVVAAHCID
jgi:hypothetical protein